MYADRRAGDAARFWGSIYKCRALLVYLPEAAYEALRQVAFDERRKIHDLLMEGVELALKKRGYSALAEMKTKWERKKA